jgi:MoaA/NifB/PqqE/SkfB family radical SAM enzyme
MISTKSTTAWAEVDESGRLVIPSEVVARYGLKTGARVRLDEGTNFVRLHRPVTQLNKVYIEPTVACNLDCITCFRNAWSQNLGKMADETFEAIFEGLKAMHPIPAVYFGGIGEPLSHPRTIAWIKRVKTLGVKVEVITNGTLLNEQKSRELIDSGVDIVWVSLDGATPASYADVRLGAELDTVVGNLRRFDKMRPGGHFPQPQIGVAFVAMKRNINELPRIIELGRSFRARHFSVSNLQPATNEMQADRLYTHVIHNIAYIASPNVPYLSLPKMDIDETTREALFAAFNSGCNVSFAGNNWGGASDVCNFVESGTLSIAFSGDVSPCWPLMHNHVSFLHGKPREVSKHVIGNVRERNLEDLWLDPGYVAYRERLHNFAFAPCTFCGGCDLSEANQEDCFGNAAPACGGCLWAQGVIQCP